ncbi:SDR family NAD(P)-dependent oxidoreductase [Nocardia sp. NPDC005825]|uniref:SDR family NAD(P)-dependent oxidoreductase n=1 Tax=unclassified Nocardia TaxID=2637762 RepID=UPI0033FEAD2F
MSAHDVFDDLLDRSVLLGYGRLGHRLRSGSWPPVPTDALGGRTALVTGANSGIGKVIATGLAEIGAAVTLVVRDHAHGVAAAAEITAAVPGAAVTVAHCDVSDLAAVRDFAAEMVRQVDRVDVLIHNAGVLPPRRIENPQGHELCLATHVLGPLLMTEALTPLLTRSAAARVILMSSGGMYTQALHPGDIEYRATPYRGAIAYARSKRIQVDLTPILADRFAPQGISVHCMHPGWVDTPGISAALPRFRRLAGPLLRTPEQGADTAVWLAATDVQSGRFWHDRRARPEHYRARTRTSAADRERVWQYCAAAAGLPAR